MSNIKRNRRLQMKEAIKQKRFMVWDGGRNQCTVFDPQTEKSEAVSKEDFIELNFGGLETGMVLIGEEAHHRSRNQKSLSHVFEFQELERLLQKAEEKGVLIYMINQDVSHLARAYAAEEKGFKVKDKEGDAYDCACFAKYLLEQPKLSVDQLREFTPVHTENHQASRDHIHQLRQELNDDILPAKKQGYFWTPKTGFQNGNGITSFIDWVKPKLAALLTEEQQALIGLKVVNKGRANERVDVNLSRVYPLAATLVTAAGTPRLRKDNQKLPYWQFVSDHLLGIRASHSKAGVAAASYKKDWRPNVSGFKPTPSADKPSPKPYVRLSCWVEAERQDEFRQARIAVDKQVRCIWRAFRQLVVEYFAIQYA